MPHERTRSLRFAVQTMRQMVDDEVLAQPLRHQAAAVLSRYPRPETVLEWIKTENMVWPTAATEAIADAADLMKQIHASRAGSPETLDALLVALRHHPTRPEIAFFATCPVQEWLEPEDVGGW